MLGLFAIGGKLLTGGKSVEEREKEWAEWSASLRPPVVSPMEDKYSHLNAPPANPMSDKYSSPEFNVYVGGSAVAGAVVPILAREYSVNPKGGR
jgi:hypothetical protein